MDSNNTEDASQHHHLHHHKFRSVLPHEPLPNEPLGYLHVQGAFGPKAAATGKDKETTKQQQQQQDNVQWTNRLELEQSLIASLVKRNSSNIHSVHVLDDEAPFTRVRIVCDSPVMARQFMFDWRRQKLSPSDLLQSAHCTGIDDEKKKKIKFSGRPLQVTQITASPLTDSFWPRSNPPKFRRLRMQTQEQNDSMSATTTNTCYVYCDGLLAQENYNLLLQNNYPGFIDAIRDIVNRYDTSGLGVQVFLSKKTLSYCHIGMRNHKDAARLIMELQGQTVEWKVQQLIAEGKAETTTVLSGKLFMDYAEAVLPKHMLQGGQRGEPTRSECTSFTKHVKIPGLTLLEDFVSEEQEELLMATLTGPYAPWAPAQTTPSQHSTVKRRVQHYAYVFDYETASVLRDRTSNESANCPPMPALSTKGCNENITDSELQTIADTTTSEGNGWDLVAATVEKVRRHKFTLHNNVSTTCFSDINQMTVNEYTPGQGIGSHVDTPSAFGDGLLSLSLNGGVVMEFTSVKSKQRKLVYLPPRSLLCMSGPARYEWEHQIFSRKTDTQNGTVLPRRVRVSLTLRTALDVDGQPMPLIESNSFPPTWGSKTATTVSFSTPDTERDHVHKVYDAIATQWHHTRGKRGVLWPGATQFLNGLPNGSVVADVGCGDGKYFSTILEAGSMVIGTDISLPLLQQASRASAVINEENVPESRRVSADRLHLLTRPEVAVADCMNVPLRSNSCDAAICIAVMHHLSTVERRIRCIQELVRIVKVGGTINIQAWAMEQEEGSRRKFATHDVFVPFNAQPRYLDKVASSSAESSPTTVRQAAANKQTDRKEDTDTLAKSVAQMYSDAYNGAEFDENKGLVVFKRYCHLYKLGELEELALQVPGNQVIESGYESGNYFVILQVRDSGICECSTVP